MMLNEEAAEKIAIEARLTRLATLQPGDQGEMVLDLMTTGYRDLRCVRPLFVVMEVADSEEDGASYKLALTESGDAYVSWCYMDSWVRKY